MKAATAENTLREHPGYRITLHRHADPARILLISFGSVGSRLSPGGFGTRLAGKYGYDNIYAAQRPGSQYQELQAEELCEAVAPYLDNYDRVVSYGASLGGYAAVYYGGPLGARIVAVSPHNSAHPLIDRSSFRLLPFTHREIADNPASEHSPIIISDPTRGDDQEFINRLILPAYPELRRVEVPYASHSVLEAFQEQGKVSQLIRPMLEHGEIPEVELDHVGSATWYAEKGRTLAVAGEADQAEQHLRAALEIDPGKKSAVRELVQLLGAQGRGNEIAELEARLQSKASQEWLPFPAGWATGRVSRPMLHEDYDMTTRAIEVDPGRSRRIAQQPGYLLTLNRRDDPADILLIAFPRAFTDKRKSGFGTGIARRQGWDCLYVSQRKGSYYQELSLEAFTAAVTPYLGRYRRVLVVGRGAGAYAALYYCGGLDATIIAWNPINVDHPRMAGDAFCHKSMHEVPTSAAQTTVVYDSAAPRQRRFLRRVISKAYPQLSTIDLPGTGRDAWGALAEAGTAESALLSLIEEGRMPVTAGTAASEAV